MKDDIKKARAIACLVAVACMILDDLPESQYNTFHDPGAAAMLSIIFANLVATSSRRRPAWLIPIVVCVGLVAKFFFQGFFWVRDAGALDMGTLLLAHILLSFMAPVGINFVSRGIICAMTFAGISFAMLMVFASTSWSISWVTFWMQLAALRILIPWLFWTTIMKVENHARRLHPATAMV
jgi:hypothetical protein